MRNWSKKDNVSGEDGEAIRRRVKNGAGISVLCELYPCYTKEAILAAAQHDPFRESDKLYEQITKEKTKMATVKKYDEQTRKAVVEDVLLNGVTQSEAAEKYGVNPKSVSYWCRTAKEKQQAYMDYAEKVEKEKALSEIERDVREAIPYAEITTGSASETVELRYDDPDRVELEEKPKKELFRVKDERRKHNPDYNTLSIKAAAFDEICGIGAEYPDRTERELLFYINGIIGLAERLRGGNDNG